MIVFLQMLFMCSVIDIHKVGTKNLTLEIFTGHSHHELGSACKVQTYGRFLVLGAVLIDDPLSLTSAYCASDLERLIRFKFQTR